MTAIEFGQPKLDLSGKSLGFRIPRFVYIPGRREEPCLELTGRKPPRKALIDVFQNLAMERLRHEQTPRGAGG